MDAASTYEKSVDMYQIHGSTSQKTAILNIRAVCTFLRLRGSLVAAPVQREVTIILLSRSSLCEIILRRWDCCLKRQTTAKVTPKCHSTSLQLWLYVSVCIPALLVFLNAGRGRRHSTERSGTARHGRWWRAWFGIFHLILWWKWVSVLSRSSRLRRLKLQFLQYVHIFTHGQGNKVRLKSMIHRQYITPTVILVTEFKTWFIDTDVQYLNSEHRHKNIAFDAYAWPSRWQTTKIQNLKCSIASPTMGFT
jgi:hypothetical protein